MPLLRRNLAGDRSRSPCRHGAWLGAGDGARAGSGREESRNMRLPPMLPNSSTSTRAAATTRFPMALRSTRRAFGPSRNMAIRSSSDALTSRRRRCVPRLREHEPLSLTCHEEAWRLLHKAIVTRSRRPWFRDGKGQCHAVSLADVNHSVIRGSRCEVRQVLLCAAQSTKSTAQPTSGALSHSAPSGGSGDSTPALVTGPLTGWSAHSIVEL